METEATDIGNVYLEEKTPEKVYIIEESGFGDREEHIIIVAKSFHGVCSYVIKRNERFGDIGFFL